MRFVILNFYESPENFYLENSIISYLNKKGYDFLIIHNFTCNYTKLTKSKIKNRFHFKYFNIDKIKDPSMLISIDFPWKRDSSYLFFLSTLRKIKSKKIMIANHLCPDPGQSCFIDDAKKYNLMNFFKSLYILEYDDPKLWPFGSEIKKRNFAIDTDYYKPLDIKKNTDILCFGTKSRNFEWFNVFKEKYSISILTSIKSKKEKGYNFFEIERNLFKIRDLINQSYIAAIPIKEEKNEACGNTAVFLSLACGVPVLIRDTKYMRRFIREGVNGFLYKNKEEFIEKLSKILKYKDELLKMRKIARQTALNFASLKKVVKDIFSKGGKMINIFMGLLLTAQNLQNYVILKSKKEISYKQFAEIVSKNDIIYAGEIHTLQFSHKIQLEILKILYEKKGEKICVGFEMLNKTLQILLDSYVEGKISEEEFLKKINWEKEWGFDFNLYKPIFDFIKEKKLKALALNVPRNIVSKVARKGLESLDNEEKSLIAKEIKLTKNKEYNKYLEETFYGHGENPMNKIMSFENYKLAMAVWNESMGEIIADFMKNNRNYSFVVIAGNGHIVYNSAIPWSVKRRLKGLKHLSVYTTSQDEINKTKNYHQLADIVVYEKL